MEHFQTFIIQEDFTGWESFNLICFKFCVLPSLLIQFIFLFLCPITAKPWEWREKKRKTKSDHSLSFSPLSILPTTSWVATMSPAAALLENPILLHPLALPSLAGICAWGGESAERVLSLSVQERAASQKLREVRADGEAERIFSTGTMSSKDVGERKGW